MDVKSNKENNDIENGLFDIATYGSSIKGITLVALVVTIIILLILATVSISTVLRRKWNYQKSTAVEGII